jgi:hypothetical protein
MYVFSAKTVMASVYTRVCAIVKASQSPIAEMGDALRVVPSAGGLNLSFAARILGGIHGKFPFAMLKQLLQAAWAGGRVVFRDGPAASVARRYEAGAAGRFRMARFIRSGTFPERNYDTDALHTHRNLKIATHGLRPRDTLGRGRL